MNNRAVFLDRDGVINRAVVRDGRPYPPVSLDELEILPGVAQALLSLKAAGFILVVVSNQPDVARGTVPRSVVESINSLLAAKLPLDRVVICYHDSADACSCRKPQPGMLLSAASDLGLDLGRSFMVGDRWRDVEAGQSAGCRTFFIDYGYNERQPAFCDYRVTSLAQAAEIILADG